MPSPPTEHVVIILRERPPAAVAMALHRQLGLGVSEVLRRVETGEPLLDRGLWLNDRVRLERLLEEVLSAIGPYAHDLHVVPPGAPRSADTLVDPVTLWALVRPEEDREPPPRPEPDAALAASLAQATRSALAELPARVAAELCLVALVTTGEGLRPFLGVTVHGPGRWDLADSDHAIVGDAHLQALTGAWEARGHLLDLDDGQAEAELAVRLATLEAALRLLDQQALFGAGDERLGVLLLATLVPPDGTEAGYARRLNPGGPLLRAWLCEASESPNLDRCPTVADDVPPVEIEAPSRVLAQVWRLWRGVALPDGTVIYAPEEIGERNETYQVAEYAPGWVLIGDDGGGRGYLVRRGGPDFDPALGRVEAEVYRIDLGALGEDIADEADFVTDDLVGWLAQRQQ